MPLSRDRVPLTLCLLFAAGVFLTGINWGLPSRESDVFQFGGREPWTGIAIQTWIEGIGGIPTALPRSDRPRAQIKTTSSGRWNDPNRGADVDADPITRPPGQLTRLNPAVDETHLDQRPIAEIVRRYRLFSHQPDEMITFMSLAKMKPSDRDFDPRLYQYGGLWIYPVGLCLKAAAALRFVDLQGAAGGPGYFLDHPEAFGRFYVVARLYTVAWGLIGIWAVYTIVRRIGCLPWVAAGTAIAVACLPVVVNMAHEAKPHLPGMVLTLLAVLAAARYVENGKLSYAIAAGGLCGAALGMVFSTAPAFSILPLMVLLRKSAARGIAKQTASDDPEEPEGNTWGDQTRTAIFSGLIGLVVYGLTNPYVIYHLLRGDGVLASNAGNTSAFYKIDRPIEGAINIARLIYYGCGPMALLGAIAVILLGIRAFRFRDDQSPKAVRRRAIGLLLAAPSILTAVGLSLFSAGKPGEFARFLLLTDVFLMIELFVLFYDPNRGLPQKTWTKVASLIGVLIIVTVGFGSLPYLTGFVQDGGPNDSRRVAAGLIESHRLQGAKRLLLTVEPAPWGVPPANWFDWPVMLVPKDESADKYAQPGDVIVEFEDGKTPISWAQKPMKVRRIP